MLGLKAKDRITGLEGIITAKGDFQFAPERWELTPIKLGKDGSVLKSRWYDTQRLKTLGSKQIIDVNDVEPTIVLGEEVEDSITGKRGIATARFTFINGCIRIEMTPKTLPKTAEDGDLDLVFDEQRLLIINGDKKTAVAGMADKPGGPRPGPTPYSRPTR
jgi:hypothetical protein